MALYFLQSCNNFCIYISLFTLKKWYGFVPNSNVTIKGLVCFSGRCVIAYFVTRKPDYTNRTYFHYPTFRIGCRITTKIKYLSMCELIKRLYVFFFSIWKEKLRNSKHVKKFKLRNSKHVKKFSGIWTFLVTWSNLVKPEGLYSILFHIPSMIKYHFFLFVGNGTQHSNGITLLYFLEEECKGNKRSS